MLAHEPHDPRPVPERAAGEPVLVRLGLVLVTDDGGRDVPPLPPGLHRAVLKIDVLAVEAEALVEAAELLEHRPAHEQEPAEHPIRLNGLAGRGLVEVEVPALRDDET